MAVDKLVDSTQLNSDLTSVANAIRTKGGTSAQLAFPAGFVSAVNAIPAGDSKEDLRKALNGTLTEYVDDSLTALQIAIPSSITTFICHNIASIANISVIQSAHVTALALPLITHWAQRSGFASCTTITTIDLWVDNLTTFYFNGDTSLNTLILRKTSVVSLSDVNAFSNTPFKSGGTGGTIYIPKALYDHLGDNSASDYKAASNWSTVDGYGTITWAAIEGSMYETKYGDGTDIPTT